MLRFRKKHNYIDIETIYDYVQDENASKDILLDVLKLPAKYRIVILLFYIEGYKTEEIATILRISPANVRKRLQMARNQLKLEYNKE